MSSIKIMRSEDICPNCTSYQQEIAALKEELIEAGYEFSYEYRRHEDEISSMVENLPSYRRWMDAKARLDALSAKYRPQSQSVKRMLEEVGHPESNTALRAPSSVKSEKNEQ
jgi:hypothetical protein